jgi:hypothetical protein
MLKLASENNVIAVTNLMIILARKLRAVPSFPIVTRRQCHHNLIISVIKYRYRISLLPNKS